MMKKPVTTKAPSKQVVKDIRRHLRSATGSDAVPHHQSASNNPRNWGKPNT